LFATATAAATLVSATSFAQTVAINANTPNPDRKVGLRDTSQNPYWISYADCMADDALTFHVSLSNLLGYTVQIYATTGGGSCQDETSRTGATATCWEVGAPITPSINVNQDVTLRVQDLLAANKNNGQTAKYGVGSGTTDACASSNALQGGSDQPQPLLIYFLPLQGQTVGTGAIYNTKFDLIGPTVSTTVTANAGDTLLIADWSASTSADTAGYYVYCDTASATMVTTFGDGGVDGSAPAAVCPDAGTTSNVSDAGLDADADASTASIADASTAKPQPAPGAGGAAGSAGAAGSGGTAGGGGAAGDPTGGAGGAAGTGGTAGTAGAGGDTAGSSGSSGSAGAAGTAGTAGAAGSAGSSGSAGKSGSTGSSGTSGCATSSCSANLVQGALPTIPSCGKVTGLATTHAQVDGQTNNVQHGIAVAGYDQVGNVGVLSNVACITPGPITDFFQTYRDAGGQAGGGFCNTSAVGAFTRAAPLWPWLVLCGVGISRLVRRRRGDR
jgi:hypothetical protein